MSKLRRRILFVKLAALTAIGCSIAVIVIESARADHYGGVSVKVEQSMKHKIHLWFDKVGMGDRMVGVACNESGFNPIAINRHDWASRHEFVAGLLQIKWPLWTFNNSHVHNSIKRFWHYKYVSPAAFYARLKDPVQSIRLAWLIYKHHGDQWGATCR